MKKIFFSWYWIWIIAIILMFVLGLSGVVLESTDWIFMVLVIGVVMISHKLNEIIKILSNKKK